MTQTNVSERHIKILELLGNGCTSVTEIARIIGVSEITIRRAFDDLEQQGYLTRVHGGAILVDGRSTVIPFPLRQTKMAAEKRLIAQAASELVKDGDCIALDIGSTILCMTEYLKQRKKLTVLTTSIYNAVSLLSNPSIRIVLPNGTVEGIEGAIKGEEVTRSLQSYYVDKFFLGAGAIDALAGVTEHDSEDAQIKAEIISRAKKVILLIDSSKFEKVAFKCVCKLESIDKIITDKQPTEELSQALKNANVEVVII